MQWRLQEPRLGKINLVKIGLKFKKIEAYRSAIERRLLMPIRAIIYSGNKVCCELCSWQGIKYFDGRCPRCNSLPRTRLIPFSMHYFNIPKNSINILHVAPNKAEFNYIKNNFHYNRYDRLDLSARGDIINIVGDLTRLKLDNASYDLIIIWHVLEHIADDASAIFHMYRVLRQGGIALVSVPIHPDYDRTFEDPNIPPERYKDVYGHHDHKRACGLDYYQRFEDIGFKTETLSVNKVRHDLKIIYDLKDDHVAWKFTKPIF